MRMVIPVVFLALVACEDPPTVPTESDEQADASVDAELPPPICAFRGSETCLPIAVNDGCISFNFEGQSEEFCITDDEREIVDGRVAVVHCDCGDCVHVTLAVLQGGTDITCDEQCQAKGKQHTVCPPGWEGE